MFTLSSLQSEVKYRIIAERFQLWCKQPLTTPLADYRNNPIENAGFFALYFSTHKGKCVVLHKGTIPRIFKLFSFIQWPIVGHISQILLYITIENQVGVAHRVMGEQVIQL